MLIKKGVITILLFLCFSCSQYPDKVEKVLESAGANRKELEAVIEHYTRLGDEEKLKAAWFLIENIDNKYAYSGEALYNFDVLFDFLDSLHKNKIRIPVASPVLKLKWDSLTELHGHPSIDQAEVSFDYTHITADYLINNIEGAFKTRNSSIWCSELSFNQFCEYILPYRIGTERLEPWREYLYAEYKSLLDTGEFQSAFEVGESFNKHMRKYYALNNVMREYPFDMTPKQMEKAKRGACKHLVQYEATALRSLGLPVGIDFAPLWGDLDRGHEWNTLLIGKDSIYPFDAAQERFGGIDQYPYRFAKVFRQVFASPENELRSDDIPAHLTASNRIDVTPEYTRVFNISIPITIPFEEKKKHVVICTYGNRSWTAQDWGTVDNGQAHFSNMGTNIVYIVMYFHNRRYHPASDPFVLEKNGSIRYIKPSQNDQQLATLLRKYPNFPRNNSYLESMIGVSFQGANKADFSDAVNLHTINSTPSKFEKAFINSTHKYRYVRCISESGKKLNVAELEFFGVGQSQNDTIKLKGRIIGFPEVRAELGTPYQNAFDEAIETYFAGMSDTYSWTGLDLGKPTRLTRINYCPRSDTNFIVEGDTYDLYVWQKEKWSSLGKRTATNQFLTYSIPLNGLFLLRNLSRGKEERIFTYENGTQVWW